MNDEIEKWILYSKDILNYFIDAAAMDLMHINPSSIRYKDIALVNTLYSENFFDRLFEIRFIGEGRGGIQDSEVIFKDQGECGFLNMLSMELDRPILEIGDLWKIRRMWLVERNSYEEIQVFFKERSIFP